MKPLFSPALLWIPNVFLRSAKIEFSQTLPAGNYGDPFFFHPFLSFSKDSTHEDDDDVAAVNHFELYSLARLSRVINLLCAV